MKSKINIRTAATALAVACSALLGCERQETQTAVAATAKRTESEPRYRTHYSEPPPGMEIVCDKERGLYAPARGESVWPGENHTNREEAIQHAWYLYVSMTNHPANGPKWSQCD